MFPTCQGNVAHRTASLPPFHGFYGSEVYSQHCAIVGRRRAVCSVAWWGGLGPPLSRHGRLLLGNLRKFVRRPHRCVAQLRLFAPPQCTCWPWTPLTHPGFEQCSQGTKATLCNYYSIPPKYTIHYTPSKMCSFSSSYIPQSGKRSNLRSVQLSHFYTFYILCSEDLLLISCKFLFQQMVVLTPLGGQVVTVGNPRLVTGLVAMVASGTSLRSCR